MPEIERSRNLKILGVDTGYDFSVTQYVHCPATGDLQRADNVRAARAAGMEYGRPLWTYRVDCNG